MITPRPLVYEIPATYSPSGTPGGPTPVPASAKAAPSPSSWKWKMNTPVQGGDNESIYSFKDSAISTVTELVIHTVDERYVLNRLNHFSSIAYDGYWPIVTVMDYSARHDWYSAVEAEKNTNKFRYRNAQSRKRLRYSSRIRNWSCKNYDCDAHPTTLPIFHVQTTIAVFRGFIVRIHRCATQQASKSKLLCVEYRSNKHGFLDRSCYCHQAFEVA